MFLFYTILEHIITDIRFLGELNTLANFAKIKF